VPTLGAWRLEPATLSTSCCPSRTAATREGLRLFADDVQVIPLYAPRLITAYRESIAWSSRADGLLYAYDVAPDPSRGSRAAQ